ncbi:MAG TPA: Nramp family divalent metal transporter [Acidobacteriaceae bacterium]|nr:Nramp family divalent metal transporter [Acidobacteriaceae bacterium]
MMRFWRTWRTRILLILAVLGPGFITANVDNDAGGIYTYATAGAKFGYGLLWTIIPMAIMLCFAQEISARMGVVTGKGLSELIREEFGLRITATLMLGLVLCNLGDVISEFAGVASSGQLFGINKFISVPIAAVLVWALVVFGDYKKLEKIFVFLSFLYVAYIVTAALAHPSWGSAIRQTLRLPRAHDLRNSEYLFLSVGIIGATVAPWQQFYLQASVVDKGASASKLKLAQLDAVIGSVFSVLVAAFIVIACAATLFTAGLHNIVDAADAAQSLKPLGGQYAFILFSFGLLNASLFAASILPLSTAYTVCEAMGYESGLSKRFREAPVFYGIYTGLLTLGSIIILMPRVPLVKAAVLSQVLNGVLLPAVLIFMLVLVNRKSLMGNKTNGRAYNAVAWTLTALGTGLTVLMLIGLARGN